MFACWFLLPVVGVILVALQVAAWSISFVWAYVRMRARVCVFPPTAFILSRPHFVFVHSHNFAEIWSDKPSTPPWHSTKTKCQKVYWINSCSKLSMVGFRYTLQSMSGAIVIDWLPLHTVVTHVLVNKPFTVSLQMRFRTRFLCKFLQFSCLLSW